MKKIVFLFIFSVYCILLHAQFIVNGNRPFFQLDNKSIISVPPEGLWSVATGWADGWPSEWKHINAEHISQSGKWTIFTGKLKLPQGEMALRDSYQELDNGLIQCIRRYEWLGI